MKLLIKKTDDISAGGNLGISDFRVAALLVFVILNLSLFIIRAISVWRYGALSTAGSAASVIYPIWKEVHHLPVYEWPLVYPFSLTMYNYLFYSTYGSFLKLIGASGASILTWGSLFTPVFAIMGAIAQWRLVQGYLNLRGARSALSLCFALGLWFCSSIVRGYAFAIRPDMAAVAFVMIALSMIVRQSRFGFAYAGVSFYLAWSFKQSSILTFAGICLFLLLHRRWRNLSILVTVFAALAATTLLLGSPEYRYSILVAPRIMSVFSLRWALFIVPKSLAANAYWILAPIILLFAMSARRVDKVVSLLTTVFVVAFFVGLSGMTRLGAWDHYLLEAFAAGSTLLQIAVFMMPGQLVSALVLLGCTLPGVQIAALQSKTYAHTFGTVEIANAAQYADAVAMRDRMASMKKPIFTSSAVFSLPWFSNDNRAPALVIDRIYHAATQADCHNGCIEGMMQRGEIPTVILPSFRNTTYQSSIAPDYDKSYQRALSQNYEKLGEARESDILWSIYVLKPRMQSAN